MISLRLYCSVWVVHSLFSSRNRLFRQYFLFFVPLWSLPSYQVESANITEIIKLLLLFPSTPTHDVTKNNFRGNSFNSFIIFCLIISLFACICSAFSQQTVSRQAGSGFGTSWFGFFSASFFRTKRFLNSTLHILEWAELVLINRSNLRSLFSSLACA